MRLIIAFCALLVATGAAPISGCAPQAELPGPTTISDPVLFLVQARCADGKLQVREPACPAHAQTLTELMLERRHDWPAPSGYIAQDALLGPDGPMTLWDVAPFGAFDAARGDGGEVYVVDGPTVRISITQDGGEPYLQGFYGAGCGGDGWVVFGTDAPTGSWASLVAKLSDLRVPSPCKVTSAAFTRYRLEAVSAPWIIDGRRVNLTLPTIISEHYNGPAVAFSSAMERSLFAKGVGRIVWEAWTTGRPQGAGLATRCPGDSWSEPPAAGWRLSDCRYATNIVEETNLLTGADFAWPPKLTALP